MNRIAAVVLCAALAVAGLWLARDRQNSNPSQPAAEIRHFLPELRHALSGLEGLELTYPDGTVVNLLRDAAGWQVKSLDGDRLGYPVDETQLNHFLASLTRSQVFESKTADSDHWPVLGLAPGLAVTFAGTTALPVIRIGHFEPQRRANFAHRSDHAMAVLLDRRIVYPDQPFHWLVRTIIDLPQVQIQELEINHGDGQQVVVRKQSPGQNHFQLSAIPPDRVPVSELIIDGLAAFWTDLKFDDLRRADDLADSDTQAGLNISTRTFAGDELTARSVVLDGEYWFRFDARLSDASRAGPEASGAREGLADFNRRTRGWWFRLPGQRVQAMNTTVHELTRPRDQTGPVPD